MSASRDVFISHSAKDAAVARQICRILEDADIGCWIAPRDILPGMNWGAAIVDAIKQARLMVIVLSAHSNESRQVAREVERADARNLPLITFRVEDIPPASALEYFLSAAHWFDAFEPPLELQLAGLLRTIEPMLHAESPPHPPEAAPQRAGKDVRIAIPFIRSLEGGLVQMKYADGRRLPVTIPIGIRDGDIITVPNGWKPREDGTGAGDLRVRVEVTPDAIYSRGDGSDLHRTLSLSESFAKPGTTVEIDLPTGRNVMVTMPDRVKSGSLIRLRGLGVAAHGDSPAGDLIVRMEFTPEN